MPVFVLYRFFALSFCSRSLTSKAVAEKDYSTIEGFTNNNVDSPFCLSAYLRLSELFGGVVTEEDNCNTADVIGIPYDEELYPDGVTSYFIFMTKSKQVIKSGDF